MKRYKKDGFNTFKIGAAIRQHRAALGINQAELARRCDMFRMNVNRIEQDLVYPEFVTLIDIAKALETKPSKILALAEIIK